MQLEVPLLQCGTKRRKGRFKMNAEKSQPTNELTGEHQNQNSLELERLYEDQRNFGAEYRRTKARGPRDGMADAVMEEAFILNEQRAKAANA
jgi:hypothetical protein